MSSDRRNKKATVTKIRRVIIDLAAMDDAEMYPAIPAAATELDCPPKFLITKMLKERDDIVNDNKSPPPTDPGEPAPIAEKLDPWHEPVSGDELAAVIKRQLLRHLAMHPHDAATCTLWILTTYLMDCFALHPILNVTSPLKRCGKSTLLEILEAFVHRALLASNITASALFRCVEYFAPTLIVDEADMLMSKENEELTSIINGSHRRRTARVIRMERIKDTYIPTFFCTYCAKAVAGIGSRKATITDRSITITMRRRKRDEKVTTLPADYYEQQTMMRRKLLRFSIDNADSLRTALLRPPDLGNDRARDNWAPLYSVAYLLSDGSADPTTSWRTAVAVAYRRASRTENLDDHELGDRLLHDISELWRPSGRDASRLHNHRHTASEIAAALNKLPESPWPDQRLTKGVSPHMVAKLLRTFGLESVKERDGRYYTHAKFADTFSRYLVDPNALAEHSAECPFADVAFDDAKRDDGTTESATVYTPIIDVDDNQ